MGKSKLKTRKTLLRRVRITKNGKIMVGPIGMGHLKVRKDSSNKTRKSKDGLQKNKGHRMMFKKLLGKAGKNI